MTENDIIESLFDQLPTELRFLEFVSSQSGKDYGDDGILKMSIPGSEAIAFNVEIKTQPRRSWLEQWHMRHQNDPLPPLVACLYLSPALQQYCVEHNINFIDGAGNARIVAPGIYIHISGKKGERDTPSGTVSVGIMKLLFVLLADDKAINYTYREIAQLAGISLGMVSKGFDYLESKNLYRVSQGGRRLTRVNDLYWLWVQEYPLVLRPKLKTLKMQGEVQWSDNLLLAGECWSGEVAGHILSGGYLHPENVKLFTPYSFNERRKKLDMRPTPSGNWELIECFWGETFPVRENERAWALLTIAELLATNDDRNIETARKINEKYLHIAKPTV